MEAFLNSRFDIKTAKLLKTDHDHKNMPVFESLLGRKCMPGKMIVGVTDFSNVLKCYLRMIANVMSGKVYTPCLSKQV